jgi:hypothetical protein
MAIHQVILSLVAFGGGESTGDQDSTFIIKIDENH